MNNKIDENLKHFSFEYNHYKYINYYNYHHHQDLRDRKIQPIKTLTLFELLIIVSLIIYDFYHLLHQLVLSIMLDNDDAFLFHLSFLIEMAYLKIQTVRLY